MTLMLGSDYVTIATTSSVSHTVRTVDARLTPTSLALNTVWLSEAWRPRTLVVFLEPCSRPSCRWSWIPEEASERPPAEGMRPGRTADGLRSCSVSVCLDQTAS